jgi:hypothetical protein
MQSHLSVPSNTQEWTLWICDECGWTPSSQPPRAHGCSVKPHEHYTMTLVTVVPKAILTAARQEEGRVHDELDRVEIPRAGDGDELSLETRVRLLAEIAYPDPMRDVP